MQEAVARLHGGLSHGPDSSSRTGSEDSGARGADAPSRKQRTHWARWEDGIRTADDVSDVHKHRLGPKNFLLPPRLPQPQRERR